MILKKSYYTIISRLVGLEICFNELSLLFILIILKIITSQTTDDLINCVMFLKLL